MRLIFKYVVITLLGILLLVLTQNFWMKRDAVNYSAPINGVNFVATVDIITASNLESLQRIKANWISIIPYAYTPSKSTKVVYFKDHPYWWGEGLTGAAEQIRISKSIGLKVMVKPQVWVQEKGWPGEFLPVTEEEWEIWENDYTRYILACAHLCDSLDADLFCFSTEYKMVVRNRPQFFIGLIEKIKEIYSGPLTYAANWDNYDFVPFWKDLDYIGIDAYFPLSESQTPTSEDLEKEWQGLMDSLEKYAAAQGKKVLFTEYGYRSCNYATRGHWLTATNEIVNLEAQQNAYRALYRSCWNRDFMVGGFLWKWFALDDKTGGKNDANYTPQNKPAEVEIRKAYQRD